MKLIEKLMKDRILTKDEFVELLSGTSAEDKELLRREAVRLREKYYGHDVYIRGLIEFTNYCKNNCFYCGIRRDNRVLERYRLTKEQILSCCESGYSLGYRTFVLQGGEDPWFNDDRMVDIVSSIRKSYPDCAITLSLGERSRESYRRLREAGADRYLLRHETANEEHYRKLHPSEMSLKNRKECLYELKELGYQVGAGFMVGAPGQNFECLAEDLIFLHELQPEMIGIGPFLPHHETPFADENKGSFELTIFLLSILRVMFPNVLLPATTALGTIKATGREQGMLAGCNVVMPNLSPVANRKQYELYDDKICTGDEAAECRGCLENRMASVGYHLVVDRGDFKA
ncbi:MAG: [FeFe] hydrogenase H-cluster radical SAM maturase HydE [Coprococcus sp.]